MELRGSLTVSYNTLVVAGQFVATIVCGAFSHTNQGWRWMLGLAGLPAALQFTGSQTSQRMPEHPKAPTWSIYCFSLSLYDISKAAIPMQGKDLSMLPFRHKSASASDLNFNKKRHKRLFEFRSDFIFQGSS